jgi:sialic acid synthase SpsE
MNFNQRFTIGDHTIGANERCFIIAEIGSNHNQDLSLAKKMIFKAKEAGADAIKFQSLRFDKVHIPDNMDSSFNDLFEKIKLQEDWYPKLKEFCNEAGIIMMSSPTYIESIEHLEKIDVPAYKIASAQFGFHLPLIQKAASKGKPMIMSSGLSNYGEIEKTIRSVLDVGNPNIVLLHCVTEYPTPPEAANLSLINTYQKMFGCLVGYSDHTTSLSIAATAVALGAVVVEKHITLDRTMDGPDHFFAVTLTEFKQMVQNIRETEIALGDGIKPPLNNEERNYRQTFKYKCVAPSDLSTGDRIMKEVALNGRRSPGGININRINELRHYKLKSPIKEGELIEWSDLEYEKQ